jgi:hypothetical protein
MLVCYSLCAVGIFFELVGSELRNEVDAVCIPERTLHFGLGGRKQSDMVIVNTENFQRWHGAESHELSDVSR